MLALASKADMAGGNMLPRIMQLSDDELIKVFQHCNTADLTRSLPLVCTRCGQPDRYVHARNEHATWAPGTLNHLLHRFRQLLQRSSEVWRHIELDIRAPHAVNTSVLPWLRKRLTATEELTFGQVQSSVGAYCSYDVAISDAREAVLILPAAPC